MTVSVDYALSVTIRKNRTTKKLEIDGNTELLPGGAYVSSATLDILM